MPTSRLIACHECDLLQREPEVPVGGLVRCSRCGGALYRHAPGSLDRSLAYVAAAIVVFVIANSFPIVGLEVQGQQSTTTLLGAVRALYDQEQPLVAALVLFTTFIAPLAQLGAMAYLLLPLQFGRVPHGFATVFRVLHAMQPWGMVEVFMLGLLVSLVKLMHLAHVELGTALWSFGVLIMLIAAAQAAFDAHELWSRREAIA